MSWQTNSAKRLVAPITLAGIDRLVRRNQDEFATQPQRSAAAVHDGARADHDCCARARLDLILQQRHVLVGRGMEDHIAGLQLARTVCINRMRPSRHIAQHDVGSTAAVRDHPAELASRLR
jgi:hypothetical protein